MGGRGRFAPSTAAGGGRARGSAKRRGGGKSGWCYRVRRSTPIDPPQPDRPSCTVNPEGVRSQPQNPTKLWHSGPLERLLGGNPGWRERLWRNVARVWRVG